MIESLFVRVNFLHLRTARKSVKRFCLHTQHVGRPTVEYLFKQKVYVTGVWRSPAGLRYNSDHFDHFARSFVNNLLGCSQRSR